MKKEVKTFLIEAIVLQVVAIVLFTQSYVQTKNAEFIFQGVDEFVPVKAILSDYKKNRYYNSRRERYDYKYDNIYLYEVNGKFYHITFYNESTKGSDRTLYYNPNNPNVCSKFRDFAEAAERYSIGKYISLILQCIVVMLVVFSIYRKRKYKMLEECSGVVLQDEIELIEEQNDRLSVNKESIPLQIRNLSTVKQKTIDEGEVLSIPFKLKDKMEIEKDSTWEKQEDADTREENQYKTKDFVLYTEDEYKKINL